MRSPRHLVAALGAVTTVVLTAVLAGVSAPAAVAQTTVTPGPVLFEDDFNGAAGAPFDATKWGDYSSCTYNGSAAYGGIQCGDNETLDGAGHLTIPATGPDTNAPYGRGSSIRTGDHFKFQYGTMSAWMKMPAESGYWPAFWSLNNNTNGQDVFPLGEADVLEEYSFDPRTYHGVGHTWTGNSATDNGSADNYCPDNWFTAGLNLSAAYHKYSATIEPGKITWSFDDQPCGQAYVKDPTKPWGFGPDVTRGNWLILTLAVGGAGGQNTPVAPSAKLLVDRVEVRGPATTTTATPTTTVPPTTTPPAAGPLVDGSFYRFTNTCGSKVIDDPASSTTPGTALKTWTWNEGWNQQWKAVAVGNYWKFVNRYSGLAMNVNGNSMSNGAPIIQWNVDDGLNERFSTKDLGGGVYQIIVQSSGKAVHVHGGQTTDNGVIEQQTLQTPSTCAQKWQIAKQ
jgi:hypothetical protein